MGSTRYPWLDGIYCGQTFCEGCNSDLVKKAWRNDGKRLCRTCYKDAVGENPPDPKTADDL